MEVNVVIELSRLGLSDDVRDDVVRIKCPFHADDTASCDVFRDSSNFYCHACHKKGDFPTLLGKLENIPRHVAEANLAARYGDDEKPIDPDVVEQLHRGIWSDQVMLAALRHRGISDDIIRQRRLGKHNDRVAIPIQGPSGSWVCLRKWLPDKSRDDRRPKITSSDGRGSRIRLYPFDQLQYDKIILCGGELKSLATLDRMNKHGIGALCMTCGEKDWHFALEAFFVGKRVWVCNDIDATGRQATEMRCLRLTNVAERVDALHLPLSLDEYPHGDINDYWRTYSDEDLLMLLNETEPYKTDVEKKIEQTVKVDDTKPEDVALAAMSDAAIVNKRIRCEVAVSAMDTDTYYIPSRVKVSCTRDQEGCVQCPIFPSAVDEFNIQPESTAILGMIGNTDRGVRDEIRRALKIPECRVVEFEALQNYKVTETRVQRSLDLTENDTDRMTMPAVLVNSSVQLNETYRITGKPMPHPKSQVATILASESEAVEDALSAYDPGDTGDLRAFQPSAWEPEFISEKLDATYEFYSRNVTKVYERKNLHTFMDLTWHSVLSMLVDGEPTYGTMDVLVVGDTGTGKSKVAKSLMLYYRLGKIVDCKMATPAGLQGGVEQIGGRWFASWGTIPIHDRRLVIMEELKGMKPDAFATLTEMRSSKTANITKIIKASTMARTRLIVNSNQRKHGVKMNYYSYGVAAIAELIPNPEDIRRFDAALIINGDDIDANVPNTVRPRMPELFSAELARKLVLWGWTRELDQVVIPDDTLKLAMKLGTYLCEKYTDAIPIIDRGSARFKLLRMAAALAVRTFSSDDGASLLVRLCHVEWISNLLDEEYSKPSHGYAAMSIAANARKKSMDEQKVLQLLGQVPEGSCLVERLLYNTRVDRQDFCDWCSWSRDEADIFIAGLTRAYALIRDDKVYMKTPEFVQLLRRIDQDEVAVTAAPEFVDKDNGEY